MTGASATHTVADETARVGRPRDPHISAAILAATLDLLAEEGYASLSMEAVAQRAGVHKPAVYRRWPTKLDLVVAAVRSISPDTAVPVTGDPRRDLTSLLHDSARNAQRDPRVQVGLRLMAEGVVDAELAAAINTRVLGPRRDTARAIVERGITARQLRADLDVDLVIDLLFGPIHSRVFITHRSMTRAQVERLVELVLDGIAARPEA